MAQKYTKTFTGTPREISDNTGTAAPFLPHGPASEIAYGFGGGTTAGDGYGSDLKVLRKIKLIASNAMTLCTMPAIHFATQICYHNFSCASFLMEHSFSILYCSLKLSKDR